MDLKIEVKKLQDNLASQLAELETIYSFNLQEKDWREKLQSKEDETAKLFEQFSIDNIELDNRYKESLS